ncbi:MAG: hypothetical protein FJZ01_06355 [Candidatus Sericytochromatia bacterium]|nr:hypothetical protein [Candidatus Tanganyikabacteria bacterium]
MAIADATAKKLAKPVAKALKKKTIVPPHLLERAKAAKLVDRYVKQKLTTAGSTVPEITDLAFKPAKMKGLWAFKGKAQRQALVMGRPLGGQILEFKGMVNTLTETVSGFASKVIGNLRKF